MKTRPPKNALKFLRWFCREDYIEEIEGDLTEVFEKQYEQSPTKARLKFAFNVIKYFRPEFIKVFKTSSNPNSIAMFRHNFVLTYRNFKRQKTPFIINLLSLSIGLTCTLLIYLWVHSELQVDKFHEKDDRLMLILLNEPTSNGIKSEPYTQGPLAKALAEEIPEVEHAVSVVPYEWFEGEKFILSNGGERFFTSRNQFVSEDYFKVFSFDLILGNKDQVLTDNNSIVISEELAEKLFNTKEAIGRSVEWMHNEYGGVYNVTGVFKAPTHNSTIQFDAVFNYKVFLEANNKYEGWENEDIYTYIILNSNANVDQFKDRIKHFLETKKEFTEQTLLAQFFSERYLHGHYENGIPSGGRIVYVQLFSIIAAFILVIACVNFINMSTARASTRMKEVGLKKAIGAGRNNLIIQYITESVIMAFISLILSIGMVLFFLPQFETITGKYIVLTYDPVLISSILIITLLTGAISGIYPALYLSGFNPARALKAKNSKGAGGQLIRKGLVIFQFAISVILIVSVIVIYKQVEFIQSKNLGYNKDNIIWFTAGVREVERIQGNEEADLNGEEIEKFLQILKNVPGVAGATNYWHNMVGDYGTTRGVSWPGKDPDVNIRFAQISGGYDFIETLGIEMKEGRVYSRDHRTDHTRIILNEAAVKTIGYEDPVGKVIDLWGEEREIIGVTKDFHIDSFYEEIMPVFIKLDVNVLASNIMVRIEMGNESATIDRVKQVYQDYFTAGMPFEFKFLDDNYQQLYDQEIRVGILSRYAAGIAIFISCLGLFGFATFTVQRRIKEVGIRKVLGADSFKIIYLLTVDFTKIVLIAVAISLPIGYFITARWLEDFAFRINPEWSFYVSAGLLVIIIAWLTVGMQTMRAANVNPTECLKDE
ncbi:ABC transporter permease [Fulvivirgaceae bacterium BMA10]|uniref:ABC transporter permease n=1 Tax=Splendidivirga corallicola TaxID=3051826 RepID=A0ABT8KJV9_9BACT|nr:ABC transporter permease [Fulvivirgaceae bacterium BMA10]